MDIVSSLNSAFTQVQRTENMSFGTNGNGTQVGYRERETSSGASGLPGGRGGLANFLPASSDNALSSAVQNAVAYDRSEGGGLQLRTQEGDLVKIKFLNRESANAQNQQFEGGGTTISDFSMSGSNSSQFKVVVEGDLSAQELSAIRDVLIQAREMTNTFFDGEVKEAFAMASEFSIDSEQLANVNMQLSVSETYTYAQTNVETQAVQPPATQPVEPVTQAVETAPPAAPAIAVPADLLATLSQPSVAVAAPTVSAPDINSVTQEAPARPEPVETQVHSAPDPVDNLSGALSTITSFLSQLTESLNAFNQQFQNQGSSQGNLGSGSLSFSAGFQMQFVSSLIGQMETNSDGRTSPAGELATKTVDELAMKMDAYVDAMI